MGNCFFKTDNKDESLKSYDEAISVNPDCQPALFNKAMLLYQKGEKDKANELVEKSEKLGKNPTILNSQGIILLKEEKYEPAVEKFDELIKAQPDNANAYLGKGQALYGCKKYPESIREYDNALRIKPNFANAKASKANSLDKSKKKDEAIQLYKEVEKSKDNNALYLSNYALCLYEKGLLDEALPVAERAEINFSVEKDNYSDKEKTFIDNALKKIKEAREKAK